MSTNARIGLGLADGSVLSVYHHWDGYPEWSWMNNLTSKEVQSIIEKAIQLDK